MRKDVYLLVTKWLRSCLDFISSAVPASLVGPEIMMKLYNAENASVCIRNCQCKTHYTPNQHVIKYTLKAKYVVVSNKRIWSEKKAEFKVHTQFLLENRQICKSS